MPELTYEERRVYSDEQVTAEMESMGIPTDYPDDSIFTGAEIREAIAKLSDYETHSDMATLTQGEYAASVLNAFAQLAKALNGDITTRYDGLKIRRERSATEKRETALQNLKSALRQKRRDEAIVSLVKRGVAGDNA